MTSTHRPGSPPTRAGFTLIEIMVAVSILGIMSAVAVTSWSRILAVTRVDGTAETLAKVLRDARFRSVVQSCPHGVRITNEGYAPGANVGYIVLYRKANANCADDFVANPTNVGFVAGTDLVLERFSVPWRGSNNLTPSVRFQSAELGAGESMTIAFQATNGSAIVLEDTGALSVVSSTQTIVASAVNDGTRTRSVALAASGTVRLQ